MTGWDILYNFVNQFPPIAFSLVLIAAITAMIICIIGFSRYGMDFIRHGFRQNLLSELLDKLATREEISKLATKEEIAKLATKEEIAKLATKEELAKLATKEELAKLATKEELAKLATREDINKLETEINNMDTRMGNMETELAAIKVNHFGHLKNFLTELTSILMDKHILTSENKTRLDNHLRGM